MSESPSLMTLSVADATRSPNAAHPLPSPGSSTGIPPSGSSSSGSSSQLATLLADSCREAEHLRREVATLRKRAEAAERKLTSFQRLVDAAPNGTDASASSSSAPFVDSAAARVILELEERTLRAEMAQQEAEIRKAQILESWQAMDRYLAVVELRAADARAGFTRVVSEGGPPLLLGTVPLPGTLAMGPPPARSSRHTSRSQQQPNHASASFPQLPPPPNALPNSNRRPRTPSVDSSYQPPPKRLRGSSDEQRGRESRASYSESLISMHPHAAPLDPRDRDLYHDHQQQQQQQRLRHAHGARMILPPGEHKYSSRSSRRHSRSRSRSSSTSSFDVDEMLIQATTGDEGGGASTPNGTTLPPDQQQQQQQQQHLAVPGRQAHHRGHQGQQTQPQSRPSSSHSLHPAAAYLQRGQHPDSPPYPASQSQPARGRGGSAAGGEGAGPLPQPGQVQQYQTHVFAPVVTGAPQKKSKFPVGGSGSVSAIGGPIDAPQSTAPPPQPFPPTNEAGQRICRQCGLPGRYKEGKCVEKWGPGPMGPGTVCDRCRKKMKRVERRGTLESQQIIHQQQLAAAGAGMAQQPHRGIQRTDTILTAPLHPNGNGNGSTQISFSQGMREREESVVGVGTAQQQMNHSNLRTVIPSPGKAHTHARPSPPPIVSLRDHEGEQLPTSNIGRGASAASRAHSRSGSHNGRIVGVAGGVRSARPTPPGGDPSTNGVLPPSKRSSHGSISSSNSGRSPLGQMEIDETDADADADAEAEAEAEIVGAVGTQRGDMDVDGEGDGDAEDGEGEDADADAEAELLEAVDAAEANSSSSHGGGRMKSEDA